MPSALELARQLSDHFKDLLSAPLEFRGEITVILNDPQQTREVMFHAKSELGFEMLLDITSIDHLGSEPRFEIVYHLYSLMAHQYLRVKTFVGEEHPELPSLCDVWRAANWHEREVFDMMGIRFTGHPNLCRILMWEGYPYYPLRKEFPLAGLPVDEVVKPVPMAGGPFVSPPGEKNAIEREPRGKGETDSVV